MAAERLLRRLQRHRHGVAQGLRMRGTGRQHRHARQQDVA